MVVNQHSGGEIVTMSDLDGSHDVDIFGKNTGAESESSSEEVEVVGSKRKASEDINQHSKKKAVGPSASTYKSSVKSTRQDSDGGSVAFKKKSKITT